jgi:hypothetical protein
VVHHGQSSLSRQRIPPIQVDEEAPDLSHALAVSPGESIRKCDLDALEDAGPEDHPAEDDEWASDRTRQQQSPDAGDDQKDTDLLGHLPDPLQALGLFVWRARLVPARWAVVDHFLGPRKTHAVLPSSFSTF